MLSAPHRVCFERPGEACCGAGLSSGVYGCSWFSFGFAVNLVGEKDVSMPVRSRGTR